MFVVVVVVGWLVGCKPSEMKCENRIGLEMWILIKCIFEIKIITKFWLGRDDA